MKKRAWYELPAAEDIAPASLAVAAVGMHVDQTPAHALWAAVEAAGGQRIPLPASAASLAESQDYAELFRAATLRGVFRHWSANGKTVEEFVEGYPVPAYYSIPTILDRRIEAPAMSKKFAILMRRTLQDGVGMAFHDIDRRSLLLARTTSDVLWADVFSRFDRAADLPAMLLFAEDGLATRSNFHGWLPRADEAPEQAFARERRGNADLSEVFAGLMLTRAASMERLRELSEHVIDASQTGSFGDGQRGRTAHGFARWTSRFAQPYAIHRARFPFSKTEYVKDPWSAQQCAQFDAMPVLAWVHRPQVADYRDENRAVLPSAECADKLRAALQSAVSGPLEGMAPARILFDVGAGDASGARRVQLTTAIRSVLPDFDLLDVKKGYDLNRRLGDTGAATALAGVGLASMAAWENGSTALVIHARRDDGATVLAVKPPSDVQRQRYRRRPYDAA